MELVPLASEPSEFALLSSRPLKLLVLGLAALGPLVLAGCDRQSSDKAQPQADTASKLPTGALDRSHKGSAIPDFTLRDPTGRELPLASLKGKPVLINLWATWCGPCVIELPLIDALAGTDKLRVLAVSQDSGEPEKVATFLKDRKLIKLELWLDPANDLSFHYGTGTLPTTIYYDAQGRELWRYVGERDWGDAETGKMLAEAGV